MSRYATSRVMWDVTKDRLLAELLVADPDAVLRDRDLEPDERHALATRDIRALFEFGIHPFVVYHFALRLAGGFSMPFMQEYLGSIAGLTVGDLQT